MACEKYCADCEHLDRNSTRSDWFTGKTEYKCRETGEYKKFTDTPCYKLKDKNDKGGYTPSGCFITTIVVNVLGYEDNCELLETLRSFRDNYLKLNKEYIPMLMQYDNIGPIISNNLENHIGNQRFCLSLAKYFIIPCFDLIKNEEYDKAVQVYSNMVVYLKTVLGLKEINLDIKEDINLETLGKGRTRVKAN